MFCILKILHLQKELVMKSLIWVENDILKYSREGNIMIAGDLNARIAQEEDFIPLDSDKHKILLHLSIFMSINSFFNTVSVSRYSRPITVTRDPD